MSNWIKLRDLPGRIVTGGYILHEGLGKRNADEQRVAGLHGMASTAFPVLKHVPPATFVKALSATEITTGSLLLSPVVSTRVAGAALTAFAGGLVALYLRTPALRKPGSIWPSANGTAVSKDSWMLAIGLGFVLDSVLRKSNRESTRALRKRAKTAEKQAASAATALLAAQED